MPVMGRTHLRIANGGHSPSPPDEPRPVKEWVTLIATCPHCKKDTRVRLEAEGAVLWQRGALIQNALPQLSDDERELLLTGICPPCWEEMFKDEED